MLKEGKALRRRAGSALAMEPSGVMVLCALQTLLERAERIRSQQRRDQNKLFALHAPEVKCSGEVWPESPTSSAICVSLVVTHKRGL